MELSKASIMCSERKVEKRSLSKGNYNRFEDGHVGLLKVADWTEAKQ